MISVNQTSHYLEDINSNPAQLSTHSVIPFCNLEQQPLIAHISAEKELHSGLWRRLDSWATKINIIGQWPEAAIHMKDPEWKQEKIATHTSLH